jgi:hypothetical protein
MLVAAGRAEELERTRPFGVLAAAFGCTRSSPDPRRAAIAGLLASQGAGDLGPITDSVKAPCGLGAAGNCRLQARSLEIGLSSLHVTVPCIYRTAGYRSCI